MWTLICGDSEEVKEKSHRFCLRKWILYKSGVTPCGLEYPHKFFLFFLLFLETPYSVLLLIPLFEPWIPSEAVILEGHVREVLVKNLGDWLVLGKLGIYMSSTV